MAGARYQRLIVAMRCVAAYLIVSLVYQLGACPCGCWKGSRWAVALGVGESFAVDRTAGGDIASIEHTHEPAAGAAVLSRGGAVRVPYAPALSVVAAYQLDLVSVSFRQSHAASTPTLFPAPPDDVQSLFGVYLL